MRVAYICLDPGVPVFGRKGSSVHCQQVLRALMQRGYEVELFATRIGDDIPDDLLGIRRHQLRCPSVRGTREREQALIKLNTQVTQLLDSSEPFDLIYERYALWSYSAMQFAHARNTPGILEINAPLIDEQKTYRSLHDEMSAKHIRGRCFRFASSLITVSEQVAKQIRQNYFARLKTTVVSNGVDCERFRGRLVPGNQDSREETVIGFVGTLKPWHGVSTLIEAFAEVRFTNPDVILRIVGDGPQREQLQRQVSRCSRDVRESVDWVGAIPNSQMPKVMSTFDIAVAPYPDLHEFYFSPLKILEYMASELPVIASNIGQIPSLIDDGVTGMLVAPGNLVQLVNSIQLLLDDRELRDRLGSAARLHVDNNHTWHHVVDRILATLPLSPLTQHCGIH